MRKRTNPSKTFIGNDGSNRGSLDVRDIHGAQPTEKIQNRSIDRTGVAAGRGILPVRLPRPSKRVWRMQGGHVKSMMDFGEMFKEKRMRKAMPQSSLGEFQRLLHPQHSNIRLVNVKKKISNIAPPKKRDLPQSDKNIVAPSPQHVAPKPSPKRVEAKVLPKMKPKIRSVNRTIPAYKQQLTKLRPVAHDPLSSPEKNLNSSLSNKRLLMEAESKFCYGGDSLLDPSYSSPQKKKAGPSHSRSYRRYQSRDMSRSFGLI